MLLKLKSYILVFIAPPFQVYHQLILRFMIHLLTVNSKNHYLRQIVCLQEFDHQIRAKFASHFSPRGKRIEKTMGLYILSLIGNVQMVSNFRTILIKFGVALKTVDASLNVSQETQLYGNHIILYSTSNTVMHSKITLIEMKLNTLLKLKFKLKLYWVY